MAGGRAMDARRRSLLAAASASLALGGAPGLAGCGGNPSPAPPPAPPPPAASRTWRMGFAGTPPRLDVATMLAGIDQWSTRAEIAAIHEELPWTDLLRGMSPDAILDRDKVQLAQYYRIKGLQLFFMADITDGLSRAEEAPQLRALGRSLAEPAVQQAYRDYVAAVVRKLQPEYLGLAAETNLIRAAAPPALYAAVVQAANSAAADPRIAAGTAPRFVSVQVETAWGLFGGTAFVGIDRDLQDFPFTQMVGLSSYPYFVFAQPEDIPADYYSRVLAGRTLPAMVVEGGWTSATAGTVVSTPQEQARYVARHAQLLDGIGARGVLQLLYADLDLASLPPPIPANLPLFVNIGLTDSNFGAKPALAAWDALFARRLAA
jgi:hypothetical protein